LIIKISGIVISIITILIYIEIFIIRKPSLGVLFLQLVDGWAQERSFSEDNSHIVFGLRTVAFLYLPLILFFQSFLNTKKIGDIFGLLLVGITILMNLSRGLILVSILGLVVIIYNKLRLMGRILLSIVLLISSFVILGYFLEKTQVFDVNETSNSVKIGHFLSFIDNLNIRNIFIGDGLGAYYYSKGSQAVKSYSELQPIDMLRYFGFILMPLLYFFMLFPIRKIKRNSKMSKLYCILFSIYILYSFTNPVMFHSYGLTIVVWYWSMIINEARSWN
jgi:hypothetical protein